MWCRLHADERDVDPIHLTIFAQIQRTLAGDWMLARDRLPLRLLVWAKRSRCITGEHGVAASAGAGTDMQTLQRIDAGLQRRRQRRISSRAIGEQRLSLAARHRLHGE